MNHKLLYTTFHHAKLKMFALDCHFEIMSVRYTLKQDYAEPSTPRPSRLNENAS